MSGEKNLKKEGDGFFCIDVRFKVVVGYFLMFCGFLLFLAALPRQASSVVDLRFIQLNVGTQLDFIRFVMGCILVYVGYKGTRLQW